MSKAKVIKPTEIVGGGSFTRASTATYWDANGVLQTAAVDAPRFSYDPADLTKPPELLTEAAATNLLIYPRQFDQAAGWARAGLSNVLSNVAAAPDGTLSADKIIEDTTTGGHQVYQSNNVTAGITYTFSCVIAAAGRTKATLLFNANNGAFATSYADFDLVAGVVTNVSCNSATIQNLGGGRYRCSISETAAATALGYVSIFANNGSGTNYTGDGVSGLYLWHGQWEVGMKPSSIIPDATAFVLRAGPKWESNSSGVLTQYGADVAVTAYDPVTHVSRGLSLEAAATNLVLWSESFDNPAWTKFQASVTANATAAPDGATTAELLTEGANTGGHLVVQTVTAAPTNTYALSVFAKAGAGSRRLMLHLGGGGSPNANFAQGLFDLSLGVAIGTALSGTASAANATIQAFPNGWYRCTLTCVPATSGTTIVADIRLASGLSDSYTGDGTGSIYLWGTQLEAGNLATSYIGTTSAQAARAIDVSTSPQATRAADVNTLNLCSSVPEPDTGEVLWNAATAYNIGDRVIRTTTHRLYQREVAGTTATAPENDTTNWVDIGPTNRWAMFDRKVGTATTAKGRSTVVLPPGRISGLGLLELVGRKVHITLKDAPGGKVAYSRTIDLDNTPISSFYDWFFTDYVQRTDLVLTDLPEYFHKGELAVTITGTGTVSCGVVQVGKVSVIGDTLTGATVGITSYSEKQTDKFGNTDIVKRSTSKRNNLKIITAKSDFNKIYRLLSALDAVPCIYVGAEEVGYEPMIVYGCYKDFSIEVAYPTRHLCNLEIEGLT